jgi:hypothetical protein
MIDDPDIDDSTFRARGKSPMNRLYISYAERMAASETMVRAA